MSRGFAAIGLHHSKTEANVGGVLRAAHCYGSALVALAGHRVKPKMGTNTYKTERHIPLLRVESLKEVIPFGCVPVAVDLIPGATPLSEYVHPERAFYIFGPEDGTLGKEVTDWCRDVVYIPTDGCMNLAATVNVVLFDRATKRKEWAR